MISGLAACSGFTLRASPRGDLLTCIALPPFFAFKRWFTFVDPVFAWLGLLDAAGNVAMLAPWVAEGGRRKRLTCKLFVATFNP